MPLKTLPSALLSKLLPLYGSLVALIAWASHNDDAVMAQQWHSNDAVMAQVMAQ